MPSKSNNQSILKPGDRVIAIDSAGNQYLGHLDHSNQCGQHYVLPDGRRQPFYAFPSALTATGEGQPGFVMRADDTLGIDGIERQELYVRHMQRN
jgi:hypothetical protein